MITGHGDVRLAIAAIKAGAYDFIEKPVQPDVLLSTLKRSIAARKLYLDNARLRSRAQRGGGLRSQILGRAPAIKEVRRLLADIAQLPVTVLMLGEPGTGKSLAAQALHDHGRGDGELHFIACATANEQNFTSKLASLPCDGSVIFRSVHLLGPEMQSHLAEFLRRDDRPRAVLTATARDTLDDRLFYLASGVTVELPPLRDRERDTFILLEHFLRDAAARFGRPLPMTTKEMLGPMARHQWPGNVRELYAVAERLVIGLPPDLVDRRIGDTSGLNYDDAMQRFEADLLGQALRETGGRKGAAAALLAIPRKRLYLRMKAVGLMAPGQK
jgi:two-component system C4-dicarboxylate transport response regulator DctD